MQISKVLMIVISMLLVTTGFSTPDPTQHSGANIEFLTLNKDAMHYDVDWDIRFDCANGKHYQLGLMSECNIVKSIENLCDVATISLPETVMNEPLLIDNKITRGDVVTIRLGYDNDLRQEFKGYIKDITINSGQIQIQCEDALFLFRKGVKDKFFQSASIKDIAQYLISEVDASYRLDCDYDLTYEKFTIHQASAYDVLKKLQDSKAHIFFDVANKTLHIHQPYVYRSGKVAYSMQVNIEQSNLEYDNVLDKKVEVTVESTDRQGNVRKYTTGTTGGDKINIKAGTLSEESIKQLAENTLKEATEPKYKGSFDTWLIPYVGPGYSAQIQDEDYPDKKAWYYVKSVTTNISGSGCKRTVVPSIKLS